MQLKQHVCLMAEYNEWMNEKLYTSASKLSAEQLAENKGAFFGSIIGTLNHITVGDTIWLKRFASLLTTHDELNSIRQLRQPKSLDEVLFNSLSELKTRRDLLDKTFSKLASSLSEAELAQSVNFQSITGIEFTKNLFSLLMHVFNHQTHHRGQVTTMLSQSGIDVGVTDLFVLIPNL